MTPFREHYTPSELVQCARYGVTLPKWCNAPEPVSCLAGPNGEYRAVDAVVRWRGGDGAADVLVGVNIRIGYEHADRLCVCG